MLRDLRIAIRMLFKQPGFSLIAVLTLALGIGATAAVFSLIQGVLLTPPPYRQPERMARAEGFRLIAGGVISGVGAALILSRALRTFLFEVEPADPLTLAA